MIECQECGHQFEPLSDAYVCPECGAENCPPDEELGEAGA